MKKLFFLFAATFLLVANAWGAGSCTINSLKYGPFLHVIWAWTSDASGDVSDSSCVSTELSGGIMQVITKPSSTSAPTDNYDIDLQDSGATAVDVVLGYLDDRDNTEIDRASPIDGNGKTIFLHRDTLNLVVSSAGNATQGECIVIIYTHENAQ